MVVGSIPTGPTKESSVNCSSACSLTLGYAVAPLKRGYQPDNEVRMSAQQPVKLEKTARTHDTLLDVGVGNVAEMD